MTTTRRPAYRKFLIRLKQARKDTGLTQAQVADRLNQPQNFISKCERGERRVDVVELRDLAKIYRKKITYFFDF